MKLRSWGTLHYINTIKGCSVLKIQNVNSRALVLRNLKHIYESASATHLHVPLNKELLLNHSPKRLKTQPQHQVSVSDCPNEIPDDLSSGDITLTQLNNTCKTMKRKDPEFVSLSPDKDLTHDSHLTAPLSTWNVRLPNSKNKRVKSSATCAPMVSINLDLFPISCPQLQSSSLVTQAGYGSFTSDEQLNFFDMDSTKPCHTTETTLENDQIISLATQFQTCVLNENSYSQLDGNSMPGSFLHPTRGTTEGPTTRDMGQRPPVSSVSELQKEAETMDLPSTQSFSWINKPVYDNRLVISSWSSSDMQEISGHETRNQASDDPLKNGTEIVHRSELCVLEDYASTSSCMVNSSQSFFSMPEIFNNESGCLVSSVQTDYSLGCIVSSVETDYSLGCTITGGGINLSIFKVIKSYMLQNLLDNFLRSPFCYSSSPWDSYPCSASNCDLVTLENDSPMVDGTISLISDDSQTARKNLEPKLYLTCLEDSSCADKEKQSLVPVDTDLETSFYTNAVNQLSTAETNNNYDRVLWQPPKRLPSMRKVIFPTSQENLCLAVRSREKYDDISSYKCKGNQFLGNHTEVSILSAASDSAGGESYMTDESTGKVILTKAIFSPKKIHKKPKCNKKGTSPHKRCSSPKGQIEGLERKGSSPKGRLEGSRRARSIPGLCSGRISVETCRESVVAFSQRQMQDIESIAVKLMTELKSMKDLIEQKVTDEADRFTSMKTDADEVKLAIKNAARVEEKTKKWLAMMARDCNRFCKIMSEPQRSTEEAPTATGNIMHKKKRRISFADEAGGVLCHVKYFKKGS